MFLVTNTRVVLVAVKLLQTSVLTRQSRKE